MDFCNPDPTVFILKADRRIDVGTLTIDNDEEYLYVTYANAYSWILEEINVFIGDFANVPVNKQNTPVPGKFPY